MDHRGPPQKPCAHTTAAYAYFALLYLLLYTFFFTEKYQFRLSPAQSSQSMLTALFFFFFLALDSLSWLISFAFNFSFSFHSSYVRWNHDASTSTSHGCGCPCSSYPCLGMEARYRIFISPSRRIVLCYVPPVVCSLCPPRVYLEHQ